jgi:hypothetical protein
MTTPNGAKRTITAEEIITALAPRDPRLLRTLLTVADIGEAVLNTNLRDDSQYVGGKTREGHLRELVDVGALRRTLEELVKSGAVIRMTSADAQLQGFRSYGQSPRTIVHMLPSVLKAKVAARELEARNLKRHRLMTEARKQVLEQHLDEVARIYTVLCQAEGIPTEEGA